MRKKIWGAGLMAGISVAALAAGVPAASAASTSGAESSGTTATTLPIPPLTVQTSKVGEQGGERGGDIFVSPFGDSSAYANGAEILSPDAKKVLWFHQAPSGEEDADFRTQTYDGQKVLTFWQGTGLGGVGGGTDYIYNDRYQQIAAVNAGNGYSADGHEFQLTPQGTALILSYTTSTANLTSIGGAANQKVINGLVQEVDVKTGKVLFQWNSADHVPYSESEQPLPSSASTPWDWFHINAVKLGSDGNLLVDSRDTWTTFDVSRKTGKINWQLGGKDSSFKLQAAPGQSLDDAGKIFAWQHDVEDHGRGDLTVFDNESAGTGNTGSDALTDYAYSRAATIRLNFANRTATLVKSFNQPGSQIASSQGNNQVEADGNTFVGWGDLPDISEFSPSGKLTFNASFPSGVNTYRAYRLPWHPAG